MELQRSALYQCLAETLAEPPEWLAAAGREWPLFQATRALSRQSQSARQAVESLLAIPEEPLPARRARYTRLMAGAGMRRGLGLYESGSLNGKLLTGKTFAVERWYQRFGLEIAGAELPDHASVELAYLGFLSSQAPASTFEPLEMAFLHEHAARWLPALGRAIEASGDAVYAPVGRLLSGWLEEVCADLGVPGYAARRMPSHRENRGMPALLSEDACTLCGFCVQVCPLDALAIHENDQTTSLFLTAASCSGCRKCARTCPENALAMGEALEPGGRYLLRQSDRARCLGCGALLISQAELAYVAARLDHPAWLAFCPDCRAKNLPSF